MIILFVDFFDFINNLIRYATKLYTFASMKKVFKYIGIIISVFLFGLLVAAIAIPYLYKDEIAMFATEKLVK